MIAFDCGGTTITYDERTSTLCMMRDGHEWCAKDAEFSTRLELADGRSLPFAHAERIIAERRTTGTGEALIIRYQGFAGTGYTFETRLWVESSTGDVIMEWIPLSDTELAVRRITWPAPLEFDEPDDHWVTLITHGQGSMIPNTWPTPSAPIAFDGRFWTEGGYMPFVAQIRDLGSPSAAGYTAICETPWNAGYAIDHPASGPYTHIGMWFEPSLGRMDYRRIVRYRLLAGNDASITGTAKTYRAWAGEHGLVRTLEQKAVRNPTIHDLLGCMWMHVGIKTHIQPDSSMYDADHPEANDTLVTFEQRARQLEALHQAGVERLYLHLDGWGHPGYDNQHPDYLPPNEQAGGWDGLRALADAAHRHGYLFGLHDQYRDYYVNAATHDERNAVQLVDGTIPEHARWAGGRQQYLCARLAPDYVKRNYRDIAAHHVMLDGTYLDVFTCNEGDECANPEHRMSRRECYEERLRCLRWLLTQGILTSSEEVSDWSMPELVFCHYAPYDFQLAPVGAERAGVPVPLQNLVYHDCVIEPWMMDRVNGEDYMLYALLNGGAPYLIRDSAYAGVDGDPGDAGYRGALAEDIARCRVVADLHRRVGMLEMIRFEFVDDDVSVQRSTFADGTCVTVDLNAQTYRIDTGM